MFLNESQHIRNCALARILLHAASIFVEEEGWISVDFLLFTQLSIPGTVNLGNLDFSTACFGGELHPDGLQSDTVAALGYEKLDEAHVCPNGAFKVFFRDLLDEIHHGLVRVSTYRIPSPLPRDHRDHRDHRKSCDSHFP